MILPFSSRRAASRSPHCAAGSASRAQFFILTPFAITHASAVSHCSGGSVSRNSWDRHHVFGDLAAASPVAMQMGAAVLGPTTIRCNTTGANGIIQGVNAIIFAKKCHWYSLVNAIRRQRRIWQRRTENLPPQVARSIQCLAATECFIRRQQSRQGCPAERARSRPCEQRHNCNQATHHPHGSLTAGRAVGTTWTDWRRCARGPKRNKKRPKAHGFPCWRCRSPARRYLSRKEAKRLLAGAPRAAVSPAGVHHH